MVFGCSPAFTVAKELTPHFEVDPLLQLSLLLQCLLGHLGGARETDQDDAHVVQASLWMGREGGRCGGGGVNKAGRWLNNNQNMHYSYDKSGEEGASIYIENIL